MPLLPLIEKSALIEGSILVVEKEDAKVLVILNQGTVHVLENRCGHMEVRMDDATLDGDAIVCPVHGISFFLTTGEIKNRPWETCDAMQIFEVIEKDGMIGIELDSD